jgi:tRNA-splicing ligase RtcB (3'-phosphate/5'-hydroxy nucleic acid ligase)
VDLNRNDFAPRIFASADAPADEAVLAQLADGVQGADLAAPPVVLPDFHHKSNMEMPSSIAVATRETIRPTLTSASVNCGMALIAFEMEPPTRAAIHAFYRQVRERYPYPRTRRRELSAAEVVRCATDGARFAADRFGVDPDDLDRVEEGGRIDLERHGGGPRMRRQLPELVWQLSRLRFGSVGPSNHFVELQEVEEVLDEPAATALGIRVGQLTLQYHAGGGMLASEVGALFGRRKHMPRPLRLQMAVQKPLFHLTTARSATELRRRLALYFSGGCPPVPLAGREGERLMLGNAAAMNYGFAFRLATYATLRKLAAETFGTHASRLIVDSPHNSIYEEHVGGEPALVHRHNACRALPPERLAGHPVFSGTGQPLLLPGTNRTSSYLCVAGPGAAASLHSACHGAGTIIANFEARGLSGPDPTGRTTLRFGYSDAAPREVPQLDDRGVDEALAILTRHQLVRPVARLRPMAVLN